MALCALGQLAPPVQATWVGSLLMKPVQALQGLPDCDMIEPHLNLLGWMEKVLVSRDKFFGPQTNPNAKRFIAS